MKVFILMKLSFLILPNFLFANPDVENYANHRQSTFVTIIGVIFLICAFILAPKKKHDFKLT